MSDFLTQLGDLFDRGGPVMWVLLGLSILSVTLAFERCVFWLRTHRPGRRKWLDDITMTLRKGDKEKAEHIAARDGTVYGRVVRALVKAPPHESQAVELIEAERATFERFSLVHSTIITAAPLLGILGTVLGIIRSFNLLGAAGDGIADIGQVSGGIAEALITTAFGLIVALVTLFPHMVFKAQGDRCLGAIERMAAAWMGSSARKA
ncbi:MAG: MotA/TolQ/ExbB proton channel family protein [Phycisphaerales bacterium]|nr:MotA/TolQ/ExbB proton channel family protein [Phycisphaerales bacterium]